MLSSRFARTLGEGLLESRASRGLQTELQQRQVAGPVGGHPVAEQLKLFHSDEFALRKLRLEGHHVYESGVAVLTYRKE